MEELPDLTTWTAALGAHAYNRTGKGLRQAQFLEKPLHPVWPFENLTFWAFLKSHVLEVVHIPEFPVIGPGKK